MAVLWSDEPPDATRRKALRDSAFYEDSFAFQMQTQGSAMTNNVYELILTKLTPIFGSRQELVSGNGARFTSAKKGKLTVYHADIAPGNKAEVAFETSSIAARIGSGMQGANALICELKALTGQSVTINQVHGWPRVGLATMDQVTEVVDRLAARLGVVQPARGGAFWDGSAKASGYGEI
jgi:hypothetical protein